MQQVKNVEEVFREYFSVSIVPDRIIELGTMAGSFSTLVYNLRKEINEDFDFFTSDINPIQVPVPKKMVFSQLDIREHFPYIGSLIKENTLVLCDNGNKIREVRSLNKYLKKNCVIMCHDYHESKEVAALNVEEWRWAEIFFDSVKDLPLLVKYVEGKNDIYELMKSAFWGCFKRKDLFKPKTVFDENLITVVVTSCGRLPLLKVTMDSLRKYVNLKTIIIDDSGDVNVHNSLKESYSDCQLILNEKNIGQIQSIELAYSHVKTPYILHIEDDWEFIEGNFLEKAFRLLEGDPSLMQVTLCNPHGKVISDEDYSVDGYKYGYFQESKDAAWHGFTWNPALRSVNSYERLAPWKQWSRDDHFSAQREMRVGEQYYRMGYKSAYIGEYCKHIG